MSRTFSSTISRSYLVLAAGIAVICLSVGAVLVQRENEVYASTQRAAIANEALHVANELKEKLFGMELVAERLATLVSRSGDISQSDVNQAAEQLIAHNPHVISVAIAPNLRVSHVAPRPGNEAVVGTEYYQIPEQFAGIARAYRDHSAVFSGPVTLVQGNDAYIMRYPVFLPSAFSGAGEFWGVISIVLDGPGLLPRKTADTSLTRTAARFTVAEVFPNGRLRHHMYGDVAIYEATPESESISVLGGTWQVSAIPVNGWTLFSPKSYGLAGAVLIVTFLLVVAILMIRGYALRSQEAFNVLSQAVEALDEGFLLFDKDDRLIMANSRIAEYYRIPPARLNAGLSYEDIIQFGAIKEIPDGTMENGKAAQLAPLLERSRADHGMEQLTDGRWLKTSNAKTPEGYMVGIRSDVSMQKTAQLAAEAAIRQQSEFLSTVSHELRTPLTAIAGRAALIASCPTMPVTKKLFMAISEEPVNSAEATKLATAQAEMMAGQGRKIIAASDHLLMLVNDLLDWAKAEGNELSIVQEPVNASDIVTHIVDEMKHQAQAKGLSLICMCAPARVMADPGRLKQVLYNLIGNAIKFTHEGSVTVTVRSKGKRVIFGVEDTGRGIAPENLDLVFERFKQVDGSDSRTFGGFGLGLTIARQIVRLHGGHLTVTSELDTGSRFEFDLAKAGINPAPTPRVRPSREAFEDIEDVELDIEMDVAG